MIDLRKSVGKFAKWLMFLTAICCFAVFIFIFCFPRPVGEGGVERQMAALMLSRGGIQKVESFKDESMMHGLRYFFFEASKSEISGLVTWLDLKPQSAIPEIFVGRINYAKEKVKWNFNWSTSEVYIVYRCRTDSDEWNFDMFLVDGEAVVYVTDGFYLGPMVNKYDSALCRARGRNS